MWGRKKKAQRTVDPSYELGRQFTRQAANVASMALGDPVEAATRCVYVGDCAVTLPKIVILAVTKQHAHLLEDQHDDEQLVSATRLVSFARGPGFKPVLDTEQGNLVANVPGHLRQVYLPLTAECFREAFDQQMAQSFVRVQGRGYPVEFLIARDDDPTERVLTALGATVAVVIDGTQPQAAPPPPPAAPPPFGFPQQSTAQRLQELETLRATGVLSNAEYDRKREQIIAEL